MIATAVVVGVMPVGGHRMVRLLDGPHAGSSGEEDPELPPEE